MKGNSRRISQNKTLRNIAVTGVLVSLLLYVTPFLFAGAVALVFSPIHATKTWLAESSSSLPQYIRNRSELLEQIEDLQEKLSQRGGAERVITLLSQENEELRALLGDTQQEKILAGVIGRPGQLPYDVLVLDKGFSDDVVEGAPVFIGSSVVGVVKKSFITSSVVELVTSSNFITSVFIIGPDIYTNAVGLGGGQLRVGVPQGIDIHEGDLVILPAVSSGVYGTINTVESISSRPEQYGYVSPEVSLSSMRLVGVGRTPLQPISFEEAQEIVSEVKTSLLQVPVPDGVLVVTQEEASSTQESASTTQEVGGT